MTHYVRPGTTSLFAAFDVGSGSVIAHHCRRRRHQEFLRFLKLINAAVPKDMDLVNPLSAVVRVADDGGHGYDPAGRHVHGGRQAV